jgi:hypothetical protein
MKALSLSFLALLLTTLLSAQSLPTFSPLSGRSCRDVSSVQTPDGFLFRLRSVENGVEKRMVYQVNLRGELTDSLSLLINDTIYTGLLLRYEGRTFLTGLSNLRPTGSNQAAVIASQRKFLMELGDSLSVRSTRYYDVLSGPVGPDFEKGFLHLTVHQPTSHRILGDTLFSVNTFTRFDTATLFPIGEAIQYEAVGLYGEVYQVINQLSNVGTYANSVFTDQKLYVFGDVASSVLPGGGLFNVQPVGRYDLNGQVEGAFAYDSTNSAAFGKGSTGQWNGQYLFTSYYGENVSARGCGGATAVIDIRRESSFEQVLRFKLPDCGLYPGGKTPFAFHADGSFHYIGRDLTNNQLGLYRYDSTYQLLGSKMLDLPNHLPLALYPTPDSGLLLACLDRINPIEQWVMLYKLDAQGNVSNTTRLPDALAPEVRLYPNPFEDVIRWAGALPLGTRAELRVSDLHGRLLEQRSMTSEGISLAHLPAGTYLIQLRQDGQLLRSQLMRKRE